VNPHVGPGSTRTNQLSVQTAVPKLHPLVAVWTLNRGTPVATARMAHGELARTTSGLAPARTECRSDMESRVSECPQTPGEHHLEQEPLRVVLSNLQR
jgi:hypothetical protein